MRTFSVRRRSGAITIRWTGSPDLAAGSATISGPGPGPDLDAGRRILLDLGYAEVQ